MGPKKNQQYYLYKAAIYQNYADYYKYRNPSLHVYYYLNHLKSINKAFAKVQSNPLNRNVLFDNPAQVKILHAAPNMPRVKISIDGIRSDHDYAYKSWSHYQEITPVPHRIQIYLTDASNQCLIDEKIDVRPGQFYTLIITEQGNNPKLIAVEDELSVPAGETKIRFIHLSEDTKELDIAVKSRDVIFAKVQQMQATNYLGLTPMSLELEARESGSESIAKKIPPLHLESNLAYTAIITNDDILVLHDSF